MSIETGLAGKRALVAGGGSGIGRAIAVALANEGVAIAIAGRSDRPDVIAEIAALDVSAVMLPTDLADEAQASAAPDRAAQALGGLDLLVSCAAVAEHEEIAASTTEAWSRTLETNLLGAMWLCRGAARVFAAQKSGAILIVGSTAAYHRAYGQAAYHVSKAALAAFSSALAVDLAASGVRVNLLVPGRFATGLNPGAAAAGGDDVPMGRVGQVEECGPAAVFLLSDALASYITGAELTVSGGLHLRPMRPAPAASPGI
jgi:NAD(P)-dependent dehydrogenase (short-subunit alcohol dehydrogenase family)